MAIDIEGLVAARKKAGLSQQALADLAGVSQAFVAALERGANKDPSATRLRDIERILKVKPYGLLTK